jgi:hypothetical protein
MNKSIEDKIKLIALKQAVPPPPTVLKRPESTEESLMGGGSNNQVCGITIPSRYAHTVITVYMTMIPWMYCRPHPIPGGGCDTLYAAEPIDGSMPPGQTVTDRDLPLSWQRLHPEFDPADPATWGSLFGPRGFAEDQVRWWNCQMGEDGQYGTGPCPGLTDANINEMVDLIRQLYVAKCGFVVSQAGACCTPVGDFGGFACTETAGFGCEGTFYPGKSCQQIGGDNCGLAANPLNMQKENKKAMDLVSAVIKKIKG